MDWRRAHPWVLFGVAAGVAYGLFARLTFGTTVVFVTLSLGFLCRVPMVLGALTVYSAPESRPVSLAYAVLMLTCVHPRAGQGAL